MIDSETRNCEIAQYLLVFMIRSIFSGWTQVIGHHFTRASFGKSNLKSLIDSYLSALDVAGIICRAIICDQEPSHVSLFRAAGVCPETPYIKCPSSGRWIYVIYDPPHLLKSTRNNLLTSDFMVSVIHQAVHIGCNFSISDFKIIQRIVGSRRNIFMLYCA